ncbi:hypothetical protein [Piscirickettsia salmonis]
MARRKQFKKNQPFKWKHYSGEIILWLVRWYGRALRHMKCNTTLH